MADQPRMRFQIENARLIYKNFSGADTKFKTDGSRTFAVVLDKETADKMALDGWNVRCKIPEEPGEDEFCFIEVKVGYKKSPPKIVVITERGRTNLTEETVGSLDYADIKQVDLIAQSYYWDFAGKSGISAYLKSMFVTIEEDELERKYAVNPDREG